MFGLFSRWLEGGRKQRAAAAIALQAGALNECPVCRTLTDAECEACIVQAERLAQRLLETGDERVRSYRHQPKLLIATLHEQIRKAPAVCLCEDAGGD